MARLTTEHFYRKWAHIHQRCYNPNIKSYRNYGARGIKCEWTDFAQFVHDMYPSYLIHVAFYGEKQTTIDRIDVNGSYSKKNCRWATILEQQEHRRVPVWPPRICKMCRKNFVPTSSKHVFCGTRREPTACSYIHNRMNIRRLDNLRYQRIISSPQHKI